MDGALGKLTYLDLLAFSYSLSCFSSRASSDFDSSLCLPIL